MSIKPLIEDIRLRAEKAGATLLMSRARRHRALFVWPQLQCLHRR